MRIVIDESCEILAKNTAEEIAEFIRQHPGSVLCFAAGDTPLKMLGELIGMHHRGEVDLTTVFYLALDEWVGIGYETSGSCAQVMLDNFYLPAGIPLERCCLWNGKENNLQLECQRVEDWLDLHGGRIGLTLLGVGMNGHVGFNEPGYVSNGRTGIVALDETTLKVGPKYFGGAACPKQGMTVGLKLLKQAEKIMVMVSGEKKAPIMRRALKEPETPMVPVSRLVHLKNCSVHMDAALFEKL